MSIVMRPTQLFTAVYLTKNLFAAKKRIYFFTYKNIILFKSDAFSLVSGVLAGSLYILIGQLATMLEYRVARCHTRDDQMHPTLVFTCPLCC